MKRMKAVLSFIIVGAVAGCSGGGSAAVTEQAGRQASGPSCGGNRKCPTEELCNPGDTCSNPRQLCCPHRPGPDVPFTCGFGPCYRGGGELCNPGDVCAISGQYCCPHAPGPDVPFTCDDPPCYRGGGELCQPGDQCAVEGDLCCPHAPGPRVPFTCSADPCFR